MALAKSESQLSVSALAKQSTTESGKKRNIKVLDEETYVQVRTAGITLKKKIRDKTFGFGIKLMWCQ